jgi:hypothetical protein
MTSSMSARPDQSEPGVRVREEEHKHERSECLGDDEGCNGVRKEPHSARFASNRLIRQNDRQNGKVYNQSGSDTGG